MPSFLNSLFGDEGKKYLKKVQPLVDKINSLEESTRALSDEQFPEKTKELQAKLEKGSSLDDILPEAFALVREAASRTLGQRHFDVQLLGGIVLHEGKIAEMKTGEGKTLTATLPVYLNALSGKGAHVVTVNDYLARRDAVWMGQIYHFLGLTTGCVNHDQSFVYDAEYKNSQETQDKERDELGSFHVVADFLKPVSRKDAYAADITYGTNNEFGFDFLRDNMAYEYSQKVQRGYSFAIVDEVDSILIDEARTPLIISAPDTESSTWYKDFARITPQLEKDADYAIDEKSRTVSLTEDGISKVEKVLGVDNIYEDKGVKFLRYLEQSLKAHAIFVKDKDYVVKGGEVVIIDEFTGRLMPGRRWSNGLHQAVEAKEGVSVKPESLTLATVTFQNYFRMYEKLAGMTGTAMTSNEEFWEVYNLDVIEVPTNKPMIRDDKSDAVYKTEEGKYKAIVRRIKELHEKGQPVLVGTRSVERNEYVSKLLEREGVPHEVLNAKNHEREGEIIAQAGRFGAVTIATNMAGRGVDIILGGNPPGEGEVEKVQKAGGLHVLGTERHESRRIDNQLRGRSGRQGDPGSSQFYLSLEDYVVRVFGGEKIQGLMNMLKIPEDQPIDAKMISNVIEGAQEKIEGMHFDTRKHLLKYDNVLNKHRDVVYKKREEVLERAEKGTLKEFVDEILQRRNVSQEEYKKKEEEFGDEMRQVEKFVLLRTLDSLWVFHLENMEYLRESVGLRAYGQRDPLVEYKNEGTKMFRTFFEEYEEKVVQTLMNVKKKEAGHQHTHIHTHTTDSRTTSTGFSQPQPSSVPKGEKTPGRNDPCWCGSGKKFKKCHGQ